MENVRYPLFHGFMAILIFISASGLLLNVHYCQGERKGARLFLEGESCHQKGQMATQCPMHGTMPMPEKDCCDDETHFLKLDQEQSFVFQVLQELAPAVILPAFAPLRLADGQAPRQLHFHNHKPPLITPDPQADLQVFRC